MTQDNIVALSADVNNSSRDALRDGARRLRHMRLR